MPATDPQVQVRHFYEPLTTGDTAPLDELLAPGWEAVPALQGGHGPESWKATVDYLRNVFSDLRIEFDDTLVAGDTVAVRLTVRGIHHGELMGVAGTGREIVFRAADFHLVADGRIERTWHLEDYFGVAVQLGLPLGAS